VKITVERISDGTQFELDTEAYGRPLPKRLETPIEIEGVAYRRAIPRLGVVANHRRTGHFKSLALPDIGQIRRLGLPEPPHVASDGSPAFTSYGQASEYAKRLSEADGRGNQTGEYVYER